MTVDCGFVRDREDGMSKATTRVLFALLVGTAALLLCSTGTNGHNWGDDFAAYIMQARALSDGTPHGFFEASRFTVEQSSYPPGPAAYPWGLPVLLAPVYAAFGMNMIALKSVGMASFVLFLVALWLGFRRYHSPLGFLCLISLFSLNPRMLAAPNEILSDVPFLLLSTVAVALIGILIVERSRLICGVCDNFLIGALIAGAFFIRTNGLLLLPVLAVAQFTELARGCRMDRQRTTADGREGGSLGKISEAPGFPIGRLCLSVIPYASFFGLLLAWETVLPGGGTSHVSMLRGLTPRLMIHHLFYYLLLPSDFFCHPLVYMATIPFAVVGMVKRCRADYHIVLYLALTLLLYIVWPPVQGLRFLFPIMPFYCSFLITGLESLRRGVSAGRFRSTLCLLPLCLLCACFGAYSTTRAYKNIRNNRATFSGPFTAGSREMFSFIRKATGTESTVIFFKPRAMRLMTDRKSILVNRIEDVSRGDYLCLYRRKDAYDQIAPAAVRHLLERRAARLIYQNSDFLIYRLNGH